MSNHDRQYQNFLNRRDDLRARRDRLIVQIEQAFAHVSREGGVSLSEAHAIDDYKSEEVCAAARATDTDTHWSELDPYTQDPGGSAMSFMDPIGFRYYLPACMVFALKHCFGLDEQDERTQWNGSDAIVYHLARIEGIAEEQWKHDQRMISIFDKKQLHAIARFIAFEVISAQSPTYSADPVHALRQGWTKYLPDSDIKEIRRLVPDF